MYNRQIRGGREITKQWNNFKNKSKEGTYVAVYVCVCVYIYTYIHMYTHKCMGGWGESKHAKVERKEKNIPIIVGYFSTLLSASWIQNTIKQEMIWTTQMTKLTQTDYKLLFSASNKLQNIHSFPGSWLAPLVECVTLGLGVMSWSPILGVEVT